MATSSLDPKASEYYGGFPLCRSSGSGVPPIVAPPITNMPQAHVAQAHTRHMAAMNSDWFPSMPNMLTVLGMSMPPQMPSAVAASQQIPGKTSSFLKYFPSGGFYKGTTAPAHGLAAPVASAAAVTPQVAAAAFPSRGGFVASQHHHHSHTNSKPYAAHPSASSQHHQTTPAAVSASHTAAARRMRAVPHLTDAWNAFDAVAPAQARTPLEPIGTKPSLRSSVWSGTPVAPSFQVDALRSFSVWSSPTAALSNMFGKVSSPLLKPADDPHRQDQTEEEKGFSATTIDSDDEDWMEHLQFTLDKVMKLTDDGTTASLIPSSSSLPAAAHTVEMEWA